MIFVTVYYGDGMSNSPREMTDAWERWDWLWPAIFYGAVSVSAVLTIFDDSVQNLPFILTLTGIWLAWHWSGMRLGYRNVQEWHQKALLRFLVLCGDIVFWFILVGFSPNFYFALFGMFAQFFRHVSLRFSAVLTMLLVGALIYQQLTEEGQAISITDPMFWVFVFIGVGGILLGVWISAIINQSMRRRDLIEQLEATQAQLAESERREGMLQERQRLAREIHDTLAQGFTSIVMHLEAAEQALPDQTDVLQKHLDQARSMARFSLEEARRVVQDLRPDLLEKRNLPDAIRRAAERWSEETGIVVDVTVTGDVCTLHPDIEVMLLRAAQEALNNVRKHARATEVSLTLSYIQDVIVLDVNDNGLGHQESRQSPMSGGFGLQSMREQAQQFNGEVFLEIEPGEGTTLVISVPVSGSGE